MLYVIISFKNMSVTKLLKLQDEDMSSPYAKKNVTNRHYRHTDRPSRYSVCSNNPHLMQCMRCNLIK